MSEAKLRQKALNYHAEPVPGKIGIALTKPALTQEDLSLSYTPGVAEPVREIAADQSLAYRYTNKANLVAVISNGTAVLGLGNVGALASKPVMEGKAALFKRFADVDVFDIEVDCDDADALIDTIERIAPTFGGINLEDIKAPECFKVEKELQARLNIPVFHDDQHGTAIVIGAALLNALELQGKDIADVNIVCLGAGAAGVASMHFLNTMGALKANMLMVDRKGVIHDDRMDLTEHKREFAIKTDKRTLADACEGADVLIGVSGPGLVTKEMIASMAEKPIVFALSNPVPEVMPELAFSVRNDIMLATGRSDFPNQVNNVLCFPYIFRGALDVKAHCINDAMCVAAARAICELAKEPVPDEVLAAYGIERSIEFGPAYLLPKPLDPRLKEKVSSAVAKAAIESGVAGITLANAV